MYISNIIWSFGDGVLWFIKVLIPLYVMFYAFSLINLYDGRWAVAFLIMATVLIAASVYHLLAPFECISVPFFTLGIFASRARLDRQTFLRLMTVACLLIMLFSFLLLERKLALHSILNAICIPAIFIPLFIRSYDIKIPAFSAMLSFDLYLVHNKVLMTLKDNMDMVGIWTFVGLSFIATVAFFVFRNKVLKIK